MITALLGQVRREAVFRINSGEYSERKLGRLCHVSQPQIHNVLKGARTLTPRLADRLVRIFGTPTLAEFLALPERPPTLGIAAPPTFRVDLCRPARARGDMSRPG